MSTFHFEILHQSKRSGARRGRLTTPHGVIETPCFVGVGTHGTLKAIDNQIAQHELDLMFCNTYHLILHPGADVVASMGGLHQYIGFQKPLITDSGGFQVFSLAYGSVHEELKSKGRIRTESLVLGINEEGVTFRSYRDGARIVLTPESSVLAQQQLGADFIVPLDELPPYHWDDRALRSSFERTHRWMKRSLDQHRLGQKAQWMYGVVHGGMNLELRAESVRRLDLQGFEGFALGGSLGKNHQQLAELLAHLGPKLDPKRPRHLLGIGDPRGMDLAIRFGMDSFDSAYPTQIARHGTLLTQDGHIKIRQQQYLKDPGPIDASCVCSTCMQYSKAFLHHLYKAHEPIFLNLASLHNLSMMSSKTAAYRKMIEEDQI